MEKDALHSFHYNPKKMNYHLLENTQKPSAILLWKWRSKMKEDICKHSILEKMEIFAVYLIESTKNAYTRAHSIINFLFHFQVDEAKNHPL